MRKSFRAAWAGALAIGPIVPALAIEPPAPLPLPTPRAAVAAPIDVAASPVIGTHQINRYAAINDLQARLKANPNSLSDWVILGELAHEVGVDSHPDQAAMYYRISRDAYEHALALAPTKPGLKAAVQFARDYEAGTERFQAIRDRATSTYLDARRRDLAASDYVPSVRVVTPGPMVRAIPTTITPGVRTAPDPGQIPTPAEGEAPVPAPAGVDPTPAITPAPTNTGSTDAANFGPRLIYTSPYSLYQPYTGRKGTPYTYQQYHSAYAPALPPASSDSGPLPVTLQRYTEQVQGDAGRRPVDSRFTTPAPVTTPP